MIKYINTVHLLTQLHLVCIAVCNKQEYLMHVEWKLIAMLVQCKEKIIIVKLCRQLIGFP